MFRSLTCAMFSSCWHLFILRLYADKIALPFCNSTFWSFLGWGRGQGLSCLLTAQVDLIVFTTLSNFRGWLLLEKERLAVIVRAWVGVCGINRKSSIYTSIFRSLAYQPCCPAWAHVFVIAPPVS